MSVDVGKAGLQAYVYLFEKSSETKAHRARRIDEALDRHEAAKVQRKFVAYLLATLAALATGVTNYQAVKLWLEKLLIE